ncbi:MAG: ABC-type transport auxiliary lipoprotein family protein [Pseudomonadota bacterium]
MRLPSLLFALVLAACSTSEVRLVAAPVVTAGERIPTRFQSIEVMDVSLPAYAAGEDVAVADGNTLALSSLLWADDPTRSVTLALTRNLKELTGARVASEPWPFSDDPSARVDVRVEQMLVTGAELRLSGQYFLADLEDEGRDHAHLFDLRAGIDGLSAEALATGRAELIAELARAIARDAL